MQRWNRWHWAAGIAVVVVLLVASGRTAAAGPLTPAGTFLWAYPDSCPQPTDVTLQDCINDAGPGDSISVDADDLGDIDLSVRKSLTLVAGAGFHPSARSVGIEGPALQNAIQVTVRGLSFTREVFVTLDGTGLNEVTLDRVHAHSESSFAALTIEGAGDLDAKVTSGRFVANGGTADGIDIRIDGSAIATVAIVGNTLTASGATSAGVLIDGRAKGRIGVNVMNNVVAGFGACACGQAAGLTIHGTESAIVTANLVGNTVDRSRASGSAVPAVQVVNIGGVASQLIANVYDNILARSSGAAIRALRGPNSPLTVRAGSNDLWSNDGGDTEGTTAGSGNLHLDPRFMDPAFVDYRVRDGSPVIDRGIVCSPGGIAIRDAAGHARLHGPTVDMGAFEHGAATPGGRAMVGGPTHDSLSGTSGDDILCGLGGADTLRGNGGNDYVDGGPGLDRLYAGTGRDRLFGRNGNDLLCGKDGVAGNDSANGGPGTDTARVDSGDHRISIEGNASTC